MLHNILNQAIISSVNWAEVLQKTIAQGIDIEGMQADLEALGLEIITFTSTDADLVAKLSLKARHLSLGDRACLALAQRLNLPALTTDRIWLTLDVGVDIQMIR